MNVLFVSHNSPSGNKHFGGTEYLFKEILEASSSSSINFFTMTPILNKNQITWQISNSKGITWNHKEARTLSEPYFFGNAQYSDWISEFMVTNRIDVVHVFHHLWTPLNTLPIAHNLGIKTVLSVHDFSHICDSFNLLDENYSYCGILDGKDSEKCTTCTKKRGSSLIRLTLLRAAYFKIMQIIDVITVGTRFSQKHLVDFYNLQSDKIQLILPSVATNISEKRKTPRSIVILGNFTIAKGARLSLELMKRFELKDFSFTQAGRVDPEFATELKEIVKSRENISVLGQYSLGQIPNFNASIAFFGSIWPETFCIAATEALEMGLKIVVPNIGAFSDRFKDSENSFFYEPNDVVSAVNSILEAEQSEFRESTHYEMLPYSTEILKLYSSLAPSELTSMTLNSAYDSWGISNLSLLGFNLTDANFKNAASRSLWKVFVARCNSVGKLQATKDAFSYLKRKLK